MTEIAKNIRRAAVLGAGVMGAQIAAHLAAAGIPTLVFDLPGDGDDRREPARRGIQALARLKPPPLAQAGLAAHLRPASFEDDLTELAACDFIIEAVVERMDIKTDLYRRLAPHLRADALLASNTSGLSIGALAEVLPDELRPRFCGVHFFNPPRYMHLVELIPHGATAAVVLDHLEGFLTTRLGKGVVHARDTPNFIANRVGVFAMLAIMHHAEQLGLGFDTVDALTGLVIGRPKSATFRLADVVGLDTMASVIRTMHEQLPDDPWHALYQVPGWLNERVKAGALGQKTGAGVFRKDGRQIRVLDPANGDYRDTDYTLPDAVSTLLTMRDPGERLAALAASERREAQFLWAIHRDLFHYCAVHLADIADSAREIDLAMRWGYGWDHGPFEQWQAAGWAAVAQRITADIDAGRALAGTPLPAWTRELDRVHSDRGAWSAADNDWSARSDLPVYRRQYLPPALPGEARDTGSTVHEDDSVRLWVLRDEVLLISFKTRMHIIDQAVIEGLQRAADTAERNHRGLVIWQPEGPFCAGADLKSASRLVAEDRFDAVDAMVADFQRANVALRQAAVPVVAAVRGLALGGGLEIIMHCDAAAAALESYLGLVEAGVGLLPAGGGLATLAQRIHAQTRAGDSYPLLEKRFRQVAMGQVSGSALEAMDMGYLQPGDRVVMHEHELLHAAHGMVTALDAAGYRPLPSDPVIPAAGDVGIATLRMLLTNMHAGGFISDHDLEISRRIAEVLCGGAVDRGSEVAESWLHRLEREHFTALARMPLTQARIEHMLKSGKPLRN